MSLFGRAQGLGIVPFAGVGQQVLDAGGVLPHGTPESRRGLAVGQIFGGVVTLVGGITGEVLGGITTATGIGAALGVPAIVVSTGLVVGVYRRVLSYLGALRSRGTSRTHG